jgi:hypothetical protein
MVLSVTTKINDLTAPQLSNGDFDNNNGRLTDAVKFIRAALNQVSNLGVLVLLLAAFARPVLGVGPAQVAGATAGT